MTQHRAFEAVRAPLRQLLAQSLKHLAGHRPDWWRCFVAASFDHGAPAETADALEIQHLAHVFVCQLKGERGRPKKLFERHAVRSSLEGYLRYLMCIRVKWAHDIYVTAHEQYADLVICGRLADELVLLLGSQGSAVAELADAVKRPAAAYLRNLSSDGEAPEDGDDDVTARLTEIREQLTSVHRLAEELRTESLRPSARLEQSAGATMTAAPDLGEAMRRVEQLLGQQGRAMQELGVRQERTEAAVREVAAGSAGMSVQLSGLTAQLRVAATRTGAITDSSDDDFGELPPEEDADVPSTPARVLLSEDEVRDQLIALRGQVWENCGTGPSRNGMLRKAMIDLFIEKRIVDDATFRQAVHPLTRAGMDRRELEYLPEVFEIVARMR